MGLADPEGTLTGIPSLSEKKSSKQHLKTSFEKLKVFEVVQNTSILY